MTRIEICATRLAKEEGVKAYAYNDATAKRVTCQPEGNLTIGVGINLENGLFPEEITMLLQNRLARTDKVLRSFEWYVGLDEVRASVFLDCAYNMGPSRLLDFTSTIHYAQLKSWDACASALLDSKAARRLPNRYKPLAQILITGEA